jgi:hypothetical protein
MVRYGIVLMSLAMAACAADPPVESTAQQGLEEVVELDPDCDLPSVILDDGDGTLLCLRGTGYVELSQFFHHWEVVHEPLGGTHLVPVSWDRIATSAQTTFFYASFYKDNASDYFSLISPGDSADFVDPRPFSLSVW